MTTADLQARQHDARVLATVLAAALLLAVGCTSAAAPVVAPAAEVARPQPEQSIAIAPADNPASPGGTIHWTGPATASVAVEEYGDFQ